MSETRLCADCQADISHRHWRSKRCEPCQADRERVQKRDARRRGHRTGRRCEACGCEIPERHGLALRCEQCQKALHNKRIRDWRRKNPEKARAIDRKRNPARTKASRERYACDPEYRRRKIAAACQRTGNRRASDIQAMFGRDGPLCALCGEPLGDIYDGNETHVDHILPVSKGGSNEIENRRLVHKPCNLIRGNRT